MNQSHRLGAPKNNGKSQTIIIQFARYITRCKVFKIKHLKRKNVSLTESFAFTKKCKEVLKKLKKIMYFRNLWSSEGKILDKIESKGNKIKVCFN